MGLKYHFESKSTLLLLKANFVFADLINHITLNLTDLLISHSREEVKYPTLLPIQQSNDDHFKAFFSTVNFLLVRENFKELDCTTLCLCS